jgi:hypothetical protein
VTPDPADVEDLSRLLYGFDKPAGTDWWASAALMDPNGARIAHAKAHAVLALFGDRLLPREGK